MLGKKYFSDKKLTSIPECWNLKTACSSWFRLAMQRKHTGQAECQNYLNKTNNHQ